MQPQVNCVENLERKRTDMAVEGRTLSEVEQHILDAIGQIKFGAVEVLIHDSRVVQVEKSEKTRFDAKKQPS